VSVSVGSGADVQDCGVAETIGMNYAGTESALTFIVIESLGKAIRGRAGC